MEITIQQVKILYVDGRYEYCWLEQQYAIIDLELAFINDGYIKDDARVVTLYPDVVTGIEKRLSHCYRIKHPVKPDSNECGFCY